MAPTTAPAQANVKTRIDTEWRRKPPPMAGDAEAKEEYVAEGSYTEPLTVINVPKVHTL